MIEIEAIDVCFQYAERMVIDHLNLSILQGEKVGILGKSGCGKSTLLKILAGLYEPSYGSIRVKGESHPQKIRKQVAMVMQSAMLLPVSILDNITCGHSMSDEWVRHVCEAAMLMDWIQTLPDGLASKLGERGQALSGGQAQRIAIARAMAKDASIILLDEPTYALDHETSDAIMEALRQLTKGKTVVHVTHHPEQIEDYDRIFLLEGGVLYETRNR